MVHHIVMWNFIDTLSAQEKKAAGEKIRKMLVDLKDIVNGVTAIEVQINELDSSNRELALFSAFESEAALSAYQVHPGHIEAGQYIKSVTCDRACFDYIAE